MKMINPMSLLYLAAGAFGVALAYQLVVSRKELGAAVADVLDSVNPMNQDNAIKTGVDTVVQKITGDDQQTLGGWLYDLSHPRAGLQPGETMKDGIISGGADIPSAPVADEQAPSIQEMQAASKPAFNYARPYPRMSNQ